MQTNWDEDSDNIRHSKPVKEAEKLESLEMALCWIEGFVVLTNFDEIAWISSKLQYAYAMEDYSCLVSFLTDTF